jgi:hypothetical protein
MPADRNWLAIGRQSGEDRSSRVLKKHALSFAKGPPAAFSVFCRTHVLPRTLRPPKRLRPCHRNGVFHAGAGRARKSGLFEHPALLTLKCESSDPFEDFGNTLLG